MTPKELRDALGEAVIGLPGVAKVDSAFSEGQYMFGTQDTWSFHVHLSDGRILDVDVTDNADYVPDEEEIDDDCE